MIGVKVAQFLEIWRSSDYRMMLGLYTQYCLALCCAYARAKGNICPPWNLYISQAHHATCCHPTLNFCSSPP